MSVADISELENTSQIVKFLKALFQNTENPIFLQTLANDPGDVDEAANKRHLLSRDVSAIERFVAKHDRARRGMFCCVATVAEGARTRSKETVREIVCLHQDLDFKGIAEDEPAIRAAIGRLECRPSIEVRSGGGLHLYWLLREPIDAVALRDRIEIVLKVLAEIVAGDTSTCEVSRLMRLPGTHNSKYGDMRTVVLERCEPSLTYELEDLEEWIDVQRPVLMRKIRDIKQPSENQIVPKNETETNPFLRLASQMGYKPRLDVEQALAAMGAGNIHDTQVRVSASLIHAGWEPVKVKQFLMDETRMRFGNETWDWQIEKKNIDRMVDGAVRKFSPPEIEEIVEPIPAAVTDLGAVRAVRAAKPQLKRAPNSLLAAFAVADGIIETLRQRNCSMMLTEGDVWLYGDGFWRVMTPADQQWLLTMIQGGFEAIGEPGKTASLTSAWKRLMEHPRLYVAKVPWADGSVIVCKNGALRLSDNYFGVHRPENYARRHIGADYEPASDCPRFLALLFDMLGKLDLVDLVQEWLGAALSIGSLNREERRALLLVGPSRTGKTELAKIFALLLGGPIATPSVAGISDDKNKFALSSLYYASAWIRDDAINEGDKLNPQRFKTIVTGEPIDVELKNKQIIPNFRFEIPICLTCNSLPRTLDGSDAIYNRSLVLRMENVVDEAAAAGTRALWGVPRGHSIGSAIFESEAPGILNWAITGLFRLRERGLYDIPQSVQDAIGRFKDDNNPVGEWVREALRHDPWSKVERRDLVRAFNGWQFEQEGEKAVGRGGTWLLPKLRNQISGLGDIQGKGGFRYITGLKLTDLGLAMWKAYGDANPHGGAGGCATTASDVNKPYDAAKSRGENEVPF